MRGEVGGEVGGIHQRGSDTRESDMGGGGCVTGGVRNSGGAEESVNWGGSDSLVLLSVIKYQFE